MKVPVAVPVDSVSVDGTSVGTVPVGQDQISPNPPEVMLVIAKAASS
jgi:hypothetical protein